MTTITLPRATVERALEALTAHADLLSTMYLKLDAITALRAALAQQAEPAQEQDPELSAALGWPGGISNPVLDRKTLLQMVAALMRDKLWEDHRVKHLWDHVQEQTEPAQQAEPDAYGYASRLAVAIWEKHYKDIAPQWKPLDDLMGVLTQIDNMTSGLTRLAQQNEPTGKKFLQVESVVAENATTQQQIEQTPPSDYRRGYWAGFAIGKREGRIEAEDELAQQAEPVEPVAWLAPRTVDSYSRPDLGYETCSKSDYGAFPAYTAPPQRKLVPLTEEEIKTAFHAARNAKLGASQDNSRHRLSVIEIARAVEKTSWEKNHG